MNFSGYFRNSTTSWSSVLASSTPATSWNVTTVLLPRNMRARLLPKLSAWLLVPCAWRNMKNSSAPMSSMGSSAVIEHAQPLAAVDGGTLQRLSARRAHVGADAGGVDVLSGRWSRARSGRADVTTVALPVDGSVVGQLDLERLALLGDLRHLACATS